MNLNQLLVLLALFAAFATATSSSNAIPKHFPHPWKHHAKKHRLISSRDGYSGPFVTRKETPFIVTNPGKVEYGKKKEWYGRVHHRYQNGGTTQKEYPEETHKFKHPKIAYIRKGAIKSFTRTSKKKCMLIRTKACKKFNWSVKKITGYKKKVVKRIRKIYQHLKWVKHTMQVLRRKITKEKTKYKVSITKLWTIKKFSKTVCKKEKPRMVWFDSHGKKHTGKKHKK